MGLGRWWEFISRENRIEKICLYYEKEQTIEGGKKKTEYICNLGKKSYIFINIIYRDSKFKIYIQGESL